MYKIKGGIYREKWGGLGKLIEGWRKGWVSILVNTVESMSMFDRRDKKGTEDDVKGMTSSTEKESKL